jgi:sugar lactone lactonase YvrE
LWQRTEIGRVSSPEVFPHRPRVAVPCACALGEGPVWDHRTRTLFWVDIKGPALWSWQPGAHAQAERRSVDEPVGFVLLTGKPNCVLLGLKSRIARLDLDSGRIETVLALPDASPGNRANDGTVGPDGSLYFGTMHAGEGQATGAFFHWSRNGLNSFGEKAVVTNGPAIDPARRVLYASDTTQGRVYRHPLAPEGRPGPPELFVAFQPGWGHPDGMAVDAEGHVWICHFGGSRVTRFSPQGEPVLDLPIPTAQVTKVAFGGPDLTTLYITTAATGRDREIDPIAGDLLAVEVGIRGIEACPCTLGAR